MNNVFWDCWANTFSFEEAVKAFSLTCTFEEYTSEMALRDDMFEQDMAEMYVEPTEPVVLK